MPVKLGTKDLFPYLGDYRPVNIYKGENKIAGWKWAEQSGEELYFENTYNDFVHVEIDGKSTQLTDESILEKVTLIPRTYIGESTDYKGQPSGVGFFITEPFSVKGLTNLVATKTIPYRDEDLRIMFLDSNLNKISYRVEPTALQAVWKVPIGAEYAVFCTHEIGGNQYTLKANIPTPDYPIEIHSLNDFDVVSSTEKLSEGQLEEYDYGAEYENIYKINLLLSEPLRSVGDVKDRLFRDSDGLWKIERNVEPIHPEDGSRTIEETYVVLDNPIYEVFPQDYQDKLNNLHSFQDSNYIYTVINNKTDIISENLKPMIHVKLKVKDI